MTMKHFIDICDHDSDIIKAIIQDALSFKKDPFQSNCLANKTVALLFEKPSLRTRLSFEVGIRHLGGQPTTLSKEEIGLGKRESIEDVARVISRLSNMVMIRTFDHTNVTKFAAVSDIPVINGLTDSSHPCQAIADALTIHEHCGALEKQTLVYLGDENNVTQSLAELCAATQMQFILSTPNPPKKHHDGCHYEPNPKIAVSHADAIYTDTWVSMGSEPDPDYLKQLAPYQLNSNLLNKAKPQTIVLHCLPAHRGEEITNEVIESKQSKVFDQAENRLHAQKAIMAFLAS